MVFEILRMDEAKKGLFLRMGLLCTIVVFTCVPVFAQDTAVEHIGHFGAIDWVGEKLLAYGVGVPRADTSPGKARLLAERAALQDARRNLLEVIRGVHIDSVTTVQNAMVKDDTIVSRVQGEIKFSTVENVEYFKDGTVQTTVSMPVVGKLLPILFASPAVTVGASDLADIDRRLSALENRVQTLEQQITGLKQTTAEQREMLFLFRDVVTAWVARDYPVWVPAELKSKSGVDTLRQQIEQQDHRLQQLARRLDETILRLDKMESKKPAAAPAPVRKASPYTGLVIDAREIGFRPCLKPRIYIGESVIYPGEGVILDQAVRRGYIRYYRKIDRAQQSSRVGSLPLTVKAIGTTAGERNLQLSTDALKTLKAVSEESDGFLNHCHVVIVF
jgi:uncharacterized coiled-coil protein SlyX